MKKSMGNDPIMEKLRHEHPKQGPDPLPGEDLDHWAERYMKNVRKKYGLKDDDE